MKSLLIYCALFGLSLNLLPAQSSCQTLLRKAVAAFDKGQGNLEQALQYLEDTEICDYTNALQRERLQLQKDIFAAIKNQKEAAERLVSTSINATRALQIASQDPTLALRMAYLNYQQNSQEQIAAEVLHQILSNKDYQYYQNSFVALEPDPNRAEIRIGFININRLELRAASFLRGNNQILTTGTDSLARIWRWEDDELIETHTFPYFGGKKHSSSGNLLLIPTPDYEIKCLNSKMELMQKYAMPDSATVESMIIAPNEDFFLTAYHRGKVEKISLIDSSRQILDISRAPTDEISFSADAAYLAISNINERTLKIFDSNAKLITTIEDDEQRVEGGLFFQKEGKTYVLGYIRGKIAVWDLEGELELEIEVPDSDIRAITFTPQKDFIILGTEDGKIRVFDKEGKAVKTLAGHKEMIKSLDFSPDGNYLLSASRDNTIKLWYRPQNQINSYKGSMMNAVDFSPQDSHIVVVGRYERPEYLSVFPFTAHNGPSFELIDYVEGISRATISSVKFSPDGQYIAAGVADGAIRLFNLQGKVVRTFYDVEMQGKYHPIEAISFSPDGAHVMGAYANKTRIWKLADSTVQDFIADSTNVLAASFSYDNKYMVSGDADGMIKIWNREGDLIRTWQGHGKMINDVVFSPDGRYILSGSNDHTAKLWTRQGKLLHTLSEHLNFVNDVTFHPSGAYLITASYDNTAIIWDMYGNKIQTLRQHDDSVSGLSFSNKGDMVATVGRDGRIRIVYHPIMFINRHVASFNKEELRSAGFDFWEKKEMSISN